LVVFVNVRCSSLILSGRPIEELASELLQMPSEVTQGGSVEPIAVGGQSRPASRWPDMI
jgi:hypothetical protein